MNNTIKDAGLIFMKVSLHAQESAVNRSDWLGCPCEISLCSATQNLAWHRI